MRDETGRLFGELRPGVVIEIGSSKAWGNAEDYDPKLLQLFRPVDGYCIKAVFEEPKDK
jgi:hypothetical protein